MAASPVGVGSQESNFEARLPVIYSSAAFSHKICALSSPPQYASPFSSTPAPTLPRENPVLAPEGRNRGDSRSVCTQSFLEVLAQVPPH